MRNHHETLKLQPDATEQEIRKAINEEKARLATEFDAASNAAKQAIAAAEADLLNTTKKQAYDAQLRLSQQPTATTQLPVPAGPTGGKAADEIAQKFHTYLKNIGFKKGDGSVDLVEAEKSGYKNLGLHTDKNNQKCMVLQFPTREAAEDFMNKMGLQGKGQIMTETQFKSSGLTSAAKASPASKPSGLRM